MELQNLRNSNRLLRLKTERLERQQKERWQLKTENLQRANIALTLALAETKEALEERQKLLESVLNVR